MKWEDTNCLSPDGVAQITCFQPLFVNIVLAVTTLAIFALFVMLCLGGFHYLTSGGDPKKVEQARGTLTMAFAGFILIMGAYLIISIIAYFFRNGSGIINIEDALKSFRITFPTPKP